MTLPVLNTIQTAARIDIGGLRESVPKLCAALQRRGVGVKLHLVEPVLGGPPEGIPTTIHKRSSWFKTLGISRGLKQALIDEVRGGVNIIHAHSLWRMASIYPAEIVRGTKCRFVFSPKGSMAPWMMNHRKWRKEMIWGTLQKPALKRADCFHATSEKEMSEIRRFFKQPIALIPNGVDLPELKNHSKNPSGARRLLFLGRMHKVKSVERLLQAWKILQPRFTDWELVAAGEDEDGYLGEMQALARELKLERVSFPGKVEVSERDAMYQSAEVYVLPSHTENFGIAAAEAMANGVPAVITKNAPWKNVERERCGWWSATEAPALAENLAAAMSLPAKELSEMGARGRDWMAREFSWDRVAELMHASYSWLCFGGARPDWIH